MNNKFDAEQKNFNDICFSPECLQIYVPTKQVGYSEKHATLEGFLNARACLVLTKFFKAASLSQLGIIALLL